MASDIAGRSFDKAKAMARSLGAGAADFSPVWKILGRSFAVTSFVIDGVQFIVGATDGDWNSADAINGLQFGASTFAIVATTTLITVSPVLVLVVGSVTLTLAIYSASCD